MDRSEVDDWLKAYVDAWKSYDRDQIEALFTQDVIYRYHPHDDPLQGRNAVLESWLGEGEHAGASTRDAPGTYEAAYRTIAIDGVVAVATGSTTYVAEPGGAVENIYDNCFVMRFDDSGRCREFTEWFMKRPLA